MKKIIIFIISIILIVFLINIYMILITKNNILDISSLDSTEYDCILVLGAGIRGNKPSPMLEERLLTSIDLYNSSISEKILVSGDDSKEDYDEVSVMKNYLKENSIPSHDIFIDHYGISTYDSIYRAKKIYKAKKIVIVTQKYHLYRALYIAKRLDIDAIGIDALKKEYNGQEFRNFREFFARIKDFFKCIFMPESKYLGEVFSLSSNGDKTNNK